MRPWGRGSPQISHNDIDYFRLKSLENQLVQEVYVDLPFLSCMQEINVSYERCPSCTSGGGAERDIPIARVKEFKAEKPV